MAYYTNLDSDASKKDMLQYIQSLVKRGKKAEALLALKDFYYMEFPEEATQYEAAIVVDETLAPVARAKKLFKDGNVWVSGVETYSNIASKFPKPEAVEVFGRIPLTHEDLVQLKDQLARPAYNLRLLFSHPAWDADWVLGNVGRLALPKVLGWTQDVALARRILSLPPHQLGSGDAWSEVGDGSRLDDYTFKLAIQRGFNHLLASPRVTAEMLEEFYEKAEKSHHINLYSQILANPNCTEELLVKCVQALPNLEWAGQSILKHEHVPSWVLDRLFEEAKTNLTVRANLAKHPSVSVSVLRKLSKSANLDVKNAALAQLQARGK